MPFSIIRSLDTSRVIVRYSRTKLGWIRYALVPSMVAVPPRSRFIRWCGVGAFCCVLWYPEEGVFPSLPPTPCTSWALFSLATKLVEV